MPVATKEIITYIKERQNGGRFREGLQEEVLPFIQKMYSQLSGVERLPEVLDPHQEESFTYYSYHLMIYRACMSDVNLHLSLAQENYLGYLNEKTIFYRSLVAGNPFVLKRHLTDLMDLVEATKGNPLSIEKFQAFSEVINGFAKHVDNISPAHCAGFKAVMNGYSAILLAKFLDYNLPAAKKAPDVIAKLYTNAKKSFQLAEELQKKDDVSINLYVDPRLPPPFPFQSIQEALSKLNELESEARKNLDEDLHVEEDWSHPPI